MELNELLPSGPESVAAALARDQQHVSRLEKKGSERENPVDKNLVCNPVPLSTLMTHVSVCLVTEFKK